MTSLLIDRIGVLVTNDPWTGAGPLGILRNAAVVADGGRIAWVGPASEAPPADDRLPGFVDSHTHLVFAGDRGAEFAARMRGEEYEAGGIRATVEKTRKASDEELTANATRLVAEARASGTTTVEVKSGYGLTVGDEERTLRIAAALTSEPTFLGGHVIPPEYVDDPDGYAALVAGEMLDACAPHARWADVFVERGAFDADAARTILTAAKAKGLGLRVHANQLGPGPGVQLAVELGAASADHCTHVSARDLAALSSSETVATLLPAAEFSTRAPYPDARRGRDGGAGQRLQSRVQLHDEPAVLHRARGA
jgi:imidazolonepropionase